MAYPTTLDSLTDPQSTDRLNNPSHSVIHQSVNTAIEALEAKVGINSSLVIISLDYLVKSLSSSNPGHVHTLSKGATDVTATVAEVNKLSGVTASTTELNYVDIVTPGTAEASKALITNPSRDISLGTGDITATIGTFTSLSAPLPQGYLINGKLSVTVASSHITVALKTLAGGDPSTTDPVYCRIGDTIRTRTSALSVTKNAGTNWFNAGGTELTGKEIDYFTYLGYNATDGVVIGFARILGNKYSDFSATTTSEKYAAISTITNAASTDYYEVVGRFAATLTGTNWSVPTFSPTNLINRPVYETRLLDWTSAPQPQGGTYTTVTVQKSKYQVTANNRIIVTYLSTGTFGATINEFRPTLPFTSDLGGQPGISYTAGVAAVSRTNSGIFQVVKFDAGNFATGSQGFAFNSIFDI